jgi:hypothetical protein
MDDTTKKAEGSLGIVSADWRIKQLGDFNGDGKTDILWRNQVTGEAYMCGI